MRETSEAKTNGVACLHSSQMAPLADSDSINKGEAELLPRDAWKTKYIEYYTTNAPTKVAMVTDEMMVMVKEKIKLNQLEKQYWKRWNI